MGLDGKRINESILYETLVVHMSVRYEGTDGLSPCFSELFVPVEAPGEFGGKETVCTPPLAAL